MFIPIEILILNLLQLIVILGLATLAFSEYAAYRLKQRQKVSSWLLLFLALMVYAAHVLRICLNVYIQL